MIDLIKKAALTGIGIASFTSEKIEELAKELIVKGKMSEQEGQKFVQEMVSRAEESREAFRQQTESVVKKVLEQVQLPKREDIDKLRDEISKLRSEIEELKKKEGEE